MTTIAAAPPFGRVGSRARALLRGRADDPVWARPALAGLLLATGVLYLADLAASGYANSFYSAAVQAGSQSWKAFFFGSFDSSNFITVDKPPASLWVMDISARLFGVSSWSILVPQALEGVAAVGLLYATVRRRFSAPAALVSAAAFALTPVAALMFRFNNPDALLTLLLVGGAYAVTRALEGARTRWLVLAGVLLGFGFLTKMMQSFVVVPGFAAVYLLAAPASLRRRLVQLLVSGAAMFAAAAWWVAIVALWPAGSRPYIGGSQDNSILNLIFGYNGFGRITGNERGSVVGGRVFGAAGGLGGGPGNGSGMWGPTGITRLFGGEMGTQISWLLPAALFFLAVLLIGMWRAPRTDGKRAAVLIWGTWLVVTGLVFSFAQGIIHPYYTVALAPAIGALVGIGVVWTWARRGQLLARLAGGRGRRHGSLGVRPARPDAVMASRTALRRACRRGDHRRAACGRAASLGQEPGRRPLRAGRRACLGARSPGGLLGTDRLHRACGCSTDGRPERIGQRARGGRRPRPRVRAWGRAGLRVRTRDRSRERAARWRLCRRARWLRARRRRSRRGRRPRRPAQLGNAEQGARDASREGRIVLPWVAAVIGANSAAGVQLGTNEPVMAIGGFNGTDPTPTLAQFELYVVEGKVHYFIASGGGGFGGGGGIGSSSSSSAIASWVEAHFTGVTVGGQTVYDLSKAAVST